MGKSAKFMKRPTKKVKETIKETKKQFQATIPAQKKTQIKKDLVPQAPPKPTSVAPKKVADAGNGATKKGKGKPSRILEGRPDYVDLMYGRPKSKK